MRQMTVTVCLALLLSSGFAVAQADQTKADQTKANQIKSNSESSGRTPPEDKGQLQPQGWTGPTHTSSGGAPPESPQGQSPPGMQPAPEGSTKTTVEPDK